MKLVNICAFSTLKDRNVRRFFVSTVISLTAGIIPLLDAQFILISRLGLDLTFGVVLIGLGIVSLAISTFSGTIIDRFSRKEILMSLQAGGAITMFLILLSLKFLPGFLEAELISILVFDQVYNSFFWSCTVAFTQQISTPSGYGNMNGLMEIQGQLSPVIGGIIAAFMMSRAGPEEMLIFSISAYIAGFIGLKGIRSGEKKRRKSSGGSYFSDMKEGYAYLSGRKHLLFLLILTSIPFIGVKIGNYIKPIYIFQGLNGGAQILGYSEAIYGLTAITAGLVVPFMMLKSGKIRTILLSMLIYAGGSVLMMILPFTALFLILQTTQGFGNPATRIARKTITMDLVENSMVGRVSGFVSSLSSLIMLALLFLYPLMVKDL